MSVVMGLNGWRSGPWLLRKKTTIRTAGVSILIHADGQRALLKKIIITLTGLGLIGVGIGLMFAPSKPIDLPAKTRTAEIQATDFEATDGTLGQQALDALKPLDTRIARF